MKVTPEYLRKINHIETISMEVLEAEMISIATNGIPATGCQRYRLDAADFLPKVYRLGEENIAELKKCGFVVYLTEDDYRWEILWEPEDHNVEATIRLGEEEE